MKAKWLVQTGIFDDTEEQLIQALKDNNIEYHTIQYIPFFEYTREYLKDNVPFAPLDCVVFYGSINFANRIYRNTDWYPCLYSNFKNYECSTYYPHFKGLLNSKYIMLPYADIVNKKDFLFEIFPGVSLFIRPDKGTKEFVGQICYKESFESDIKLLGKGLVEPNCMCLIAPVKNIKHEWRFVIVDGKPITGSRYRDNMELVKELLDLSDSDDYTAYQYAKLQCTPYSPDKVWTLDVCSTTDNAFHVLEIGGFSCAGLYGCDLNIVVQEVSKAAEEDYKNF